MVQDEKPDEDGEDEDDICGDCGAVNPRRCHMGNCRQCLECPRQRPLYGYCKKCEDDYESGND